MDPKNDQLTRAKRNEAAKAEFLAGLAKMREGTVQAAEALSKIYLPLESCGSVEEFARNHGAGAASPP